MLPSYDNSLASPRPPVLATARMLEDISSVSYPRHIKAPDDACKASAKHGVFRYDRGFLIQFKDVCLERP
ncbi:hypothetical protein FOMPIDRAFT_1122837, partial [Fomitopsis schrenkii]